MKNSINLIKKIKEAWPDSKILVITKDQSVIDEFKKAGLKGDHRPHDPVKREVIDNEPRYLKLSTDGGK